MYLTRWHTVTHRYTTYDTQAIQLLRRRTSGHAEVSSEQGLLLTLTRVSWPSALRRAKVFTPQPARMPTSFSVCPSTTKEFGRHLLPCRGSPEHGAAKYDTACIAHCQPCPTHAQAVTEMLHYATSRSQVLTFLVTPVLRDARLVQQPGQDVAGLGCPAILAEVSFTLVSARAASRLLGVGGGRQRYFVQAF